MCVCVCVYVWTTARWLDSSNIYKYLWVRLWCSTVTVVHRG